MLIISRDDSDCDTMIANTALLTDCREVYDCVNVIAEDIDIFVMLVFHNLYNTRFTLQLLQALIILKLFIIL